MPIIDHALLTKFSEGIFVVANATVSDAQIVSEHLVRANLYGVDSHGVMRIPEYVRKLEEGIIKPGRVPKVVKETPITAVLDAQFGFGQVSAIEATKLAIRKAEEVGLSAVTVFNCNHVGRVGEYPVMALEHGMLCFIACKGVPCKVAPWGGSSGVLSTNPVSFAIPAGEERPIIADFATSAVAEGKLRIKVARGEKIPLGWVLGKDGKPTSDPEEYYRGGVLLPFGEHKGYALNILVEALGGALTGAGVSNEFTGHNGLFILVLDLEKFVSLKEFKDSMDRLIRMLKAAKKAEGFSEILVPGEPEARTLEKRMKEGIPIEEKTWSKILEVANRLRVHPPEGK